MSDRTRIICLGLILALALGVRASRLNNGFQQDEFGPVYAIGQRDHSVNATPAKANPLVPVPSWEHVRTRSVLPYGIVNPVPLHNYLLHGIAQVLPITEWSLRLPSLLAGLATVWAMYRLARALAGGTAGLLAALFTAIDPTQIAVSTMARPYALASLACVLSLRHSCDDRPGERRSHVHCAARHEHRRMAR